MADDEWAAVLRHSRLEPQWIGMPHSSSIRNVYDEVHAERIRAHIKHAAHGNSRENANMHDTEWLPILGEEFGEVCRALTYDQPTMDMRKELVQVAAMAVAWIEAIDAVHPR